MLEKVNREMEAWKISHTMAETKRDADIKSITDNKDLTEEARAQHINDVQQAAFLAMYEAEIAFRTLQWVKDEMEADAETTEPDTNTKEDE